MGWNFGCKEQCSILLRYQPNTLLGTLFDPCRLAYLTYTLNGSVRPLSHYEYPDKMHH
jgi:hypothetical protein